MNYSPYAGDATRRFLGEAAPPQTPLLRKVSELLCGHPLALALQEIDVVTPEERAIATFTSWYTQVSQSDGLPAKGKIADALAVLDALKSNFNLDIDTHTAEGGSQIKGASGSKVKAILARYGETRRFVSEGGRTNRGLRGDIRSTLDMIGTAGLGSLDEVERIHNTGIAVSNESYSTADVQLNRQGDFLIGDTVFHVTLAPAAPVFEKCKRNLDDGYRVFLLVPDDMVIGARQNAEMMASGQIAVEAIESFVGQNIDEMSNFSAEKLREEFLALLNTYNHRVDAVEIDKSVMIEIPPSLER